MQYFEVSNLQLQRTLWLIQDRQRDPRWSRWLDRFNALFWRIIGS